MWNWMTNRCAGIEIDASACDTECFDKKACSIPIDQQPIHKNAHRHMKECFNCDYKHIVRHQKFPPAQNRKNFIQIKFTALP